VIVATVGGATPVAPQTKGDEMFRAFTAAFLIAVAAATLVAIGSAGRTVTAQRIAIEEKFNPLTRTGTWRVVPLTPGAIVRESGKLTFPPGFQDGAMRNRGTVALIDGPQRLTGKSGTFVLSQDGEHADVWMGGGYGSEAGSWKLTGGTGRYAGFTGGGRFAGVALLNGTVVVRQEGYVSR
jgi:hypothetical protein